MVRETGKVDTMLVKRIAACKRVRMRSPGKIRALLRKPRY